jgi:hypothetical protein
MKKGQRVAKPSLRNETIFQTVDGASCSVELWARQDLFTLFASFNTLIDLSAQSRAMSRKRCCRRLIQWSVTAN